MKVSIIVPMYNVEKYIKQCIESVLAQEFCDWEMIIVDDGSTDESGRIADRYADADSRITVIHQSNNGPGAARNKGIAAAKGDYIYFLDSDDYIDSNLLQTAVAAMEQNDSDMVVFNFRNEDEEGRCLETSAIQSKNIVIDTQKKRLQFYAKELLGGSLGFCVWNKIFKRSIILDNSIYFEEKENRAEDICFNMQYAVYMEKVSCISDVLKTYRIRKGSIMNSETDVDIVDLYTDISFKIYNLMQGKKEYRYLCKNYYIIFAVFMLTYNAGKSAATVAKRVAQVKNREFFKRMNCEYICNYINDIRILGMLRATNCLRFAIAQLAGISGCMRIKA